MRDQITVIFICGPGSEEYIGFAITTLIQTSEYPERFNFLIGYNKPLQKPEYFQTINVLNKITLLSVVNYLQEASSSHMKSLTETLQYIEEQNQSNQTKKIEKVLICDADIAFLHQGWDTLMESLITPTNIMVGTAYPTNAEKKYQNFPTLYVALIDFPKFQSLNIDLMPDLDNKDNNHVRRTLISTKQQSNIFGVPIGKTIKYDSGYQIPIKIKEHSLTGTPFENREVTSIIPQNNKQKYGIFTKSPSQATLSLDQQKSPTPSIQSITPIPPYIFYEIYHDNKLLFTHLGNSRNKDYHTHPEPIYWRQICENYIQKNYKK